MSNAFDADARTRQAVNQLTVLLDILHPEPGPDIYTLQDFVYRHPFTGLGELATREIEQAQRINRALGDYLHIGLCELNIGQIYLYWGDYRGAVSQFSLARRQWSFINKPTSVSLAYFAEGNAQELAYHYESALSSYIQAQQSLSRIKFSPPAPSDQQFVEFISDYLADAQKRVRQNIWFTVQKQTQELPNPDEYCPGCVWCEVTNDTLSPRLKKGTYLLVNTHISEHQFLTNEYVVIGSETTRINSVHLQPFPPQRIKLMLAKPQHNWRFTRDVSTGTVTLIPDTQDMIVQQDDIFGIVIGFWHTAWREQHG